MKKKPNNVTQWRGRLLSFMLIICMSLPSFAGLQQGKVNLQMTSVSVQEVIEEIGNQTGIGFLYRGEELKSHKIDEVNFTEKEWEEVLTEILDPIGKTFKVEKDLILIVDKPKEAPKAEASQEKKSIKGKVTDDQGVPLPGVSVVIKGTNVGVATDIDGNYTLEFDQENTVLVFSFVGMSPQEISYSGQKVINVTLGMDTEQVAEVVVTGYQTIAKERATGSFQIVNEEDLEKTASLDLVSRIKGVSPGLQVKENGEMLIRGTSSLYAKSSPLIVLNGIPWEGNISDINPDDVDQLTVLKDAASTAIYGVRGANGVIVITTKSGSSKGKLKISYSGNLQIEEAPNAADYGYMNAVEHADFEWDNYSASGFYDRPTYNIKTEIGEIYKKMINADPADKDAAEALAKTELNALKAYDNNSDINKYFYRNAITHKHTLGFDFASEQNKFYASVGYADVVGNAIGEDSKKINFNVNDHFSLNKHLTLKANVLGSFSKSNHSTGNPMRVRPYVRLKDTNGKYVHELDGVLDLERKEEYENLGIHKLFVNQIRERELNSSKRKSKDLSTNLTLEIKPFDWMSLQASYGYSISDWETNRFDHKDSYAALNVVNRHMKPGAVEVIPYGNILKYDRGKKEGITSRLQTRLNKHWDDFSVSLNAGIERNKFITDDPGAITRYNYDPQRLTETQVMFEPYTSLLGNKIVEKAYPEHRYSEDRYQSFYSIGNFSYKQKYDLSFSWRLDKTNLFGQSSEYRDQPSWSIGSKWQLSDEGFFKVDWVDNLSLKVSYGVAGNVDKSTSPYMIANAQTHYSTRNQYLSVSNPANPLLGWEKTYTTNIGADFSMFRGKLSGSIEFYKKNSKDVLTPMNVDPTTGIKNGKFNNGEVINKGFDLSLMTDVINSGDFSYNIGLNISYVSNKVSEVDKITERTYDLKMNGIYGRRAPIVGQPVDYIWTYKHGGIDKDGNMQFINRDGNIVPFGELDNLQMEDGKFIGPRSAPWYGSLSQSFRYKKFTADVFVTYEFGHYEKRFDIRTGTSEGGKNPLPKILADRWKKAGDEKNAILPKMDRGAWYYSYIFSNFRNTDVAVSKLDNIQIRSINFGYDFTDLLNVKQISNLKLKAGVENLWYWTAAKDGKLNGRHLGFPTARRFVLGLSCNF